LNPSRVVILGGGVAGLTAGWRLAATGRFRPVILEREPEPGGLARSLHFKGVSTDLGPHRLHTEIPEIAALVDSIAAPSLYTIRRRSRIYLQGRFLTYPPRLGEVLAHLGPLRCLRFGLSLLGESLRPARGPETYESLMRRAFGPELYAFLLRPYSAKVWKTDPAQIHPDTARVRVSAGSLAKLARRWIGREAESNPTALRQFRYVRGGVETLVRHLREHAEAAGAELQLAEPATALDLEPTPGPAGWRVAAVRSGRTEDHRRQSDAVISTVPLPILLGRLLPPEPGLASAREAAAGLTYLNMIFVCVIVRRKVISGENWLYFPEAEFIFNRAYEAKTFDPAMGPEDRSVLCVELTARPDEGIETEPDAALAAEVIAQLGRTGLFGADEVEEWVVYRLRYGYPLYALDYRERLARVFDGLKRISNLLTAGRQGLFNHNNTDHSMYMGLRAADALAAETPAPAAERWYAEVEAFKHFRIVD